VQTQMGLNSRLLNKTGGKDLLKQSEHPR
jgi:hypothetical protein